MSDNPPLIGRDGVLEELEQLVLGQRGAPRSVSLHGDPGVGKSALLRALGHRARGRGFQVLEAAGVEFEKPIPFGALHQLVQTMLGSERLGRLPSRQRAALLGVFGMAAPEHPDQLLVSVSVLQLLSDLCDDGPVLLVIDDAQWVDDSSAEVIAFVARRITVEPISAVFALRDVDTVPWSTTGFTLRSLGPLRPPDAADLLDQVAPELDRALRRRVLTEARGNPLALLELPACLSAPAGDHPPAPMLTLSARLEAAFTARVARLSPPAQLVALVAAAEDSDELVELLEAAQRLIGADADTESAALMEQLTNIGILDVHRDRFEFRHSLFRSAVYGAASRRDRRRAHDAIARVTVDAERSVWHQAAARDRPSETTARALEAAAFRLLGRGAAQAAVNALDRAAALTPTKQARNSRWLRAAELAVELKDLSYASEIAALIDAESLPSRDQQRLVLVTQSLDPGAPGDTRRLRRLLAAAAALQDSDVLLAARFVHAAAEAAWWADPGHTIRDEIAGAAWDLPLVADDPRRIAILGMVDPVTHAQAIVDRAGATAPEHTDTDTAVIMGLTLGRIGAFDLSASFLRAAVSGLRSRGSAGRLAEVLTHQAWTAINMMRRDLAAASAEEAVWLAEETKQPLWQAAALSAKAMLAAFAGDVATVDTITAEAEALALPLRGSAVLCGLQLVRGVAALGVGSYDEAYAALLRPFNPSDAAHHPLQSLWAVGDLTEAAIHSGRAADARTLIQDLHSRERLHPSPWVRVGVAYGEALLAEEDKAAGLFSSALDSEMARWPSYRARLLLEYGAWARRHRHTRQARGLLRQAREACDALGLRPWAMRARQELRAAGEQSLAAPAEPWAALSPQELQIAQLAAAGLSNREIAARLFLSHRTVGSHLYHIFPKLGVTSRSALGSRLPPSGGDSQGIGGDDSPSDLTRPR